MRPPQVVWAAGLSERAVAYARVVQTLGQMKACLASGYPFAFGFSVYESFESDAVAASGVVPLPASSEELLGGHAVLAVGYDDASQRFIVRNSWGEGWGQGGYFTMPYAYLGDRSLASDLWTIRLMAKP
jgi:C1A family cysteine protease